LSATQASSADAFGINEHRERVPTFFHDRPRDLVLRFPAIIEADDRASRRYIFLATPPRQQILHADYGNPGIFELFHLRLEIGRCDLGARLANFIDRAVITKDDGLRGLIANGFRNLWLRSRWANGCRSRRGGGRLRTAGATAPKAAKNTGKTFTTVVVDAGHGGKDNGAHRRFGGAEKIATLDVAQRLDRKLRESEIKTVMTRSSDVFISLDQRVAIENS